jgi:galactonate dehydratase
VALAACLHFDLSTPAFFIQETFADFDVPWRNSFVRDWNPLRQGEFVLSDAPGLGLMLDDNALADHPYVPNAFPSLWDGDWLTDFTQTDRTPQ